MAAQVLNSWLENIELKGVKALNSWFENTEVSLFKLKF